MIYSGPLGIPVILGTTRKSRISAHPAKFMTEQLEKRQNVMTELLEP